MASLQWIGKEAVVGHHREVPYHLLKGDVARSVGDNAGDGPGVGSGNLLVQGDNLLALKALLPYYAGRVKCIYIDPPYNTGKEGWIYNDNVNSPEIRQWLHKEVKKEGETLDRHDRWLCMMYPRIALLKEFLCDEGVIFISIDDNEIHNARVLLDEIFGVRNLLSCFVWQTDGNFDNQAKVKIAHEYVLAYGRDLKSFEAPSVIDPAVPRDSKLYRPEIRNTVVKNGPGNPVSDFPLPIGFPADFVEGVILARSDKWPNYDADVVVRNSRVVTRVIARSGWSSKRIMTKFVEADFNPVFDTKQQLSRFVVTRTGAIEAVKVRSEAQSHVISVIREVGNVQTAGTMLEEIGVFNFPYPKPLGLIQYLLEIAGGDNPIILDSFAGSGTTAHAVLAMNKADGGNRKCILVEMDPAIATDITAQRLRKVIEGYYPHGDTSKSKVEGTGGGLRYVTLGDPVFNEDGRVKTGVNFTELAAHIFFTETGEPIPKRVNGKRSPLLGACRGTAYYLLFNGILGDKRPDGGNVLTSDVLADLPEHDGPRVVFGEACRLGEARLKRAGVTFRQIPYQIRTS